MNCQTSWTPKRPREKRVFDKPLVPEAITLVRRTGTTTTRTRRDGEDIPEDAGSRSRGARSWRVNTTAENLLLAPPGTAPMTEVAIRAGRGAGRLGRARRRRRRRRGTRFVVSSSPFNLRPEAQGEGHVERVQRRRDLVHARRDRAARVRPHRAATTCGPPSPASSGWGSRSRGA